ncbi:MAG: hypothetical protein U0U67_01480 [Chitinophagales bacterium]
MKKVFFLCMTVSLLATSCDWFTKSKPTDDPEVVTNDDDIVDTLATTNDTTAAKKDSSVAVVETKPIETKKEVKK